MDDVAVAHFRDEALADGLEQLVASAGAERVVDAFEIIDVDEQQTDLLLGALGEAQQQAQLLGEQAPIRQRGDAVEVGQLVQLVARFGGGLGRFLQFLPVLGELLGALVYFQIEYFAIRIHAPSILVKTRDDAVEHGGDFADFNGAANRYGLGLLARGNVVRHPRQGVQGRHNFACAQAGDKPQQKNNQYPDPG